LKLPPLEFVETEKLTGSPETGFPFASETSAVTVVLEPGNTVDGARVKLTLAAGPATKVTLTFADKPDVGSLTVTVARPVIVDAINRT